MTSNPEKTAPKNSFAAVCAVAPETLVKQFQEKRPLYEGFTTRVQSLLKDLLDAAGIRYHLIEGRTKDVVSLSEKICRPGKNYEHAIDEIPDLSGLRIIAYYLDDVDRIADLIDHEFAVDTAQSDDKRNLLEENEFGYLSIHFVIRLSSSRVAQTEWKRFSGLHAEIQVRTVLQHAWAAISHALDYKSKKDIPTGLRRKLYRLCGIFELADEEFLSLKRTHDQLSSEIARKITEESLDIDVSLESLARYVDHTGLDGRFLHLVDELGWRLVPYCHGNRMEDYSDLRAICELTGIRSISDFDDVIQELTDKAHDYMRALATLSTGTWSVSPLYVLQLLVLVHCGVSVEVEQLLSNANWDPETAQTVLTVARAQRIR